MRDLVVRNAYEDWHVEGVAVTETDHCDDGNTELGNSIAIASGTLGKKDRCVRRLSGKLQHNGYQCDVRAR